MSYIGKSPAGALITPNDLDPTLGVVTTANTQTMTGTKIADNGSAAVSGGGTYNFTGSDQIVEITLTGAGAVTLGTVSGVTPKAFYCFMFKAGDTSARTYSWNSTYWKFPSATSDLTTAASTIGSYDIVTFMATSATTLAYIGHVEDVR